MRRSSKLWSFVSFCFGAALAWSLPSGCGETCRSPNECPLGSHCVLTVGSSGLPSGSCESECVQHEDCGANPDESLVFNFCTADGKCEVRSRPPRLKVLDPENDSLLPEGTRTINLSGVVETAAESVQVEARPSAESGCSVTRSRTVTILNPNPGAFSSIPFFIEDVAIESGVSLVEVSASIEGAIRNVTHLVEVPCPGCAEISLDAPVSEQASNGLLLPLVAGTVTPAVPAAVWRVRSDSGDVFDGQLRLNNGRFRLEKVPLFAGPNLVEVLVSGVGEGEGESRCSRVVTSGLLRERGLRALLTWDGETSDLDVHLVGPGGQLGDAATSVFPTSPNADFEGAVDDDFDGLGPETATVPALSDGTYGVAVFPVFDGDETGSSGFMRVLINGRLVVPGAIGPQYLSQFNDTLWIVGKVVVAGETATWVTIDEILPASNPPTTSPDQWPTTYY